MRSLIEKTRITRPRGPSPTDLKLYYAKHAASSEQITDVSRQGASLRVQNGNCVSPFNAARASDATSDENASAVELSRGSQAPHLDLVRDCADRCCC